MRSLRRETKLSKASGNKPQEDSIFRRTGKKAQPRQEPMRKKENQKTVASEKVSEKEISNPQ